MRAEQPTCDESMKWVMVLIASRVSLPSSLRTVPDRENGMIFFPVLSGSRKSSPWTPRQSKKWMHGVCVFGGGGVRHRIRWGVPGGGVRA